MSAILAFILYNLEVVFFWLLRGWDQVQIVLVSNHIYIVLVSNPPILTYDFDLILGSICLFGALLGWFCGWSRARQFFLGLVM